MDLRARRQERTRAAIVTAAYALFAERGFDQVTVADIAERAEVGRTTFFRYFGDKQEVVFAQQDALLAGAPRVDEPIADLAAAMRHIRAMVGAYTRHIVADPDLYTRHEELVARNPELTARSLVKQRAYAETTAAWLADRGADPATARLAAELGLACFYAGRDAAGNDPATLATHVDAAFERVG